MATKMCEIMIYLGKFELNHANRLLVSLVCLVSLFSAIVGNCQKDSYIEDSV